jgi:uncharacterized cupredoxin-like copper-binding protein
MRRLACIFAVALLLGACGGSDDDGGGDQAAPKTTASTSAPADALDGLDVTLNDNYFDPKLIVGEGGTLYRFDLLNEGESVHNFSLGSNISVDVPAGTTSKVEVVLPESGDVEFFCKFHKVESGMTGTLRVAP